MILKRSEFLTRTSIDEQTLEVWLSEEWLMPAQASHGEAFTDADVARAHLIHDLGEDMGVNEAPASAWPCICWTSSIACATRFE